MPRFDTTAYKTYLRTPDWAERRKHKLEQTGGRCQACGTAERPEVHHLSYKRLGHERPEELMVLCRWCHALEHGRDPGIDPVIHLDLEREASHAKLAHELRQYRQLAVDMIEIIGHLEGFLAEIKADPEAPKWLREGIAGVLRQCRSTLRQAAPHAAL